MRPSSGPRFWVLVRYVLWLMVLLAVSVVGVLALDPVLKRVTVRSGTPTTDAIGIGGDFSMITHKGHAFTQADLGGRPTIMFFGFTTCPDICPSTLIEMTGWLDLLGADADRINAIFVSVDPERDTPDILASYLTAFDRRIIGLTGTPEQLELMARRYKFYYERIAQDGDNYTIDHTASVYMLDKTGTFVGAVDRHEPSATRIGKIRMLVNR